MKVWTVLSVIVVLWACCSIFMEDERKLTKFDKIIFSTNNATREKYMYFIKQLRIALLAHGGDASGKIALLPPQTMRRTDPRRYLMVVLTTGDENVTLVLDVANVYVLGYGAGTTATPEKPFYFFNDIAEDVQNVLFKKEKRRNLSFSGDYGSLEHAAKANNQPIGRRYIPLGISHLNNHIQNMNYYQPGPSDNKRISRALLVCIQMVSEPARFKIIEEQIAKVATECHKELYPDVTMMGFQTNWGQLSTAVQIAAPNGIFRTVVIVVPNRLNFTTVESVQPVLALALLVCERRRDNPHSLHKRSTGLEPNCDKVLEPTSHITGRDGLCLEVNQGNYNDGNWIALSTCVQNRGFQLWTFRSDNTIRSGGKCLTTSGYVKGDYVMIYDCNMADTDATKWEMQSNGSIRNPRSGLLLDATTESKGVPWLVVGRNIYASQQAFYATNNTDPLVTTIVGYQGLCLLASGSRVWLEKCVSSDDEQKWNKYPDETIRPQKNQKGCLKYGDGGGDSVSVETCDGWTEERWLFQNDGTILHVVTGQVMDVRDTSAALPQITVNAYNEKRLSQIWFQVQP